MPSSFEQSKRNLEHALRDSPEARDNKMQVALTEESRVILQSLLRDEMAQAVKTGIEQAMSKEAAQEFAKVFMDQMQAQATMRLDSWSGGMLRRAIKQVLFFGFMGSVVYSVGGWGALAAAGKWFLATVSVTK